MSENPSELPLDRIATAIERQAAAWETIAAAMPALIEAMGKRNSWGGKKQQTGEDHGFYHFIPSAESLAAMKAGDTFHVVAGSYRVINDKGRIYFDSPFADPKDSNKFAYLTSLALDSKVLKGWNPTGSGSFSDKATGAAEPRQIHLQVGADKEDATKRYCFAVSIHKLDKPIDQVEWKD